MDADNVDRFDQDGPDWRELVETLHDEVQSLHEEITAYRGRETVLLELLKSCHNALQPLAST